MLVRGNECLISPDHRLRSVLRASGFLVRGAAVWVPSRQSDRNVDEGASHQT